MEGHRSRPEDGPERRGAVKPQDGGTCAEGREDRSRRYRRRHGRHGWPGTGQRSCVRRVTTATPEWFGWGRQRPGAVARDRASVCPAWRRAGSHRRQLASASAGQRGRLPVASGSRRILQPPGRSGKGAGRVSILRLDDPPGGTSHGAAGNGVNVGQIGAGRPARGRAVAPDITVAVPATGSHCA